jgi:hypothetical protein
MWSFPFSLQGTLVLIGFGLLGLLFILRFLSRRSLTMSYAIVWILVLLGMLVLVGVPPVLTFVGNLLGTAQPEGAIRLLAMAVMAGFLLFLSVKVSVLTYRLEDLSQRLSLQEYEHRERSSSPEQLSKSADPKNV